MVPHLRACPLAPHLHDQIAAALADPDNPGYAISSSTYRLTSGALGLPSEGNVRAAGLSWEQFCARFGLQSPNQRTAKSNRRPEPEAVRFKRLDDEVREMEGRDAEARRYEREWGLAVCSSRQLPDGSIAHMLR